MHTCLPGPALLQGLKLSTVRGKQEPLWSLLLALVTWQEGVGHTMGPRLQEHSLGVQLQDRGLPTGEGGYLS